MAPTITDRILEKLKDLIPGVKVYFDGDPYAIGQRQLPAIIVESESASVRTGPTGMDRVTETIVIKYVLNKKDDFGKSSTGNENYRKLKAKMFGRDKVTGLWQEETIMHAIRKNFTLDGVVINQEVDVEYFVAARPDEQLTAEVHATIIASELVEVQSRG